ncbi:MAG: hypothetical protein AAF988_04295 [Pseudomonadota bacterium]
MYLFRTLKHKHYRSGKNRTLEQAMFDSTFQFSTEEDSLDLKEIPVRKLLKRNAVSLFVRGHSLEKLVTIPEDQTAIINGIEISHTQAVDALRSLQSHHLNPLRRSFEESNVIVTRSDILNMGRLSTDGQDREVLTVTLNASSLSFAHQSPRKQGTTFSIPVSVIEQKNGRGKYKPFGLHFASAALNRKFTKEAREAIAYHRANPPKERTPVAAH